MKKKILIVEDEKMLAEMYKNKLENEGFGVLLAFDAAEALELAKKEKPDMILLDILLPGEKNGLFFLKNQKQISEIAQIPVIAFSNYDDPKTKKEALEMGAKDYLIKADYTPREIVEKIKIYLKY